MPFVGFASLLLVAATAAATTPIRSAAAPHGTIFLGGQPVEFDADFKPRFTARQLRGTDAATRDGLARLAATPHGRKLLAYITAGEYEIDVAEDLRNGGAGKAPEPGIATILAANDHSVVKKYSIALDPTAFALPSQARPLSGQPVSAAGMMAAAWAGELLHVYFYTRGIPLPHHSRSDFQEEWRAVAVDLGFPLLEHDDGPAPPAIARPGPP